MSAISGKSPDASDGTADAILRLRQRHGLSQRQVSEMLGVGLRTLQRWEAGEQAPPAYFARALRDLSHELSKEYDGSIAGLVDEYAYVRLIARLAHRARTRVGPEASVGSPRPVRLAELPSGLHTPCVIHAPALLELGMAGSTLALGDELRVEGRRARVTGFEPPLRPVRTGVGFSQPGVMVNVEWPDD